MGNIQGSVLYEYVVSGGDQVAAQGARIEVTELRAANQFFVSILSPDFVEQARCEFGAEGFPRNSSKEDRAAGRER